MLLSIVARSVCIVLCGVRCCDVCLSVCPHLHMWFLGFVGCTFQPYWSQHLEGLDGACFYSQCLLWYLFFVYGIR